VPLPCGYIPECWPGSPTWTPDAKQLTFTLRTPGSHAYALYAVATDGSGLRKLLDFGGTLTDLKYGPDGSLALLGVENARKEVGATQSGAAVAGDLDAAPPEQRIAVFSDGKLHWRSPANLFVYEYDWRRDAQGFVATAAPGDGDDNWWVAKLYAFTRDGAMRILYTPTGLSQQLAAPRVSPDGRSVVFIAGLMSDFGYNGGDVYSVELDSGRALDVTPGIKASAEALEWGCHGELLVQMIVGGGTQIVDLGDARAPNSAPHVLWGGAEHLRGLDSAGAMACPMGVIATTHESFTAPPEIEVGAIGQWHDVTHVNAGLATETRVLNVTWNNEGFDGQGWLLLPPHSGGKMPLITIVHGGPAGAAQPSFMGPGEQSRMLERGWAVFHPNPRGSYGEGERFTRANIRDFGHGDLRDILAGIDAAERAAPIDDTRLGLYGGSYGGFMTMWAVTQTNRFKAAVASAGISDWLSYYGENGIDEWMLPYFGASVYEDPAVYARSSAINYIRNVHTPTFEYVGERDIECPAPQTQEFWHALKAIGVPTSIMIYPGEGHRLRQPEHARDALERTIAWFDHYLK
jgi:dipeptidyl aminopeptidase/acylaminoacyl peptidase